MLPLKQDEGHACMQVDHSARAGTKPTELTAVQHLPAPQATSREQASPGCAGFCMGGMPSGNRLIKALQDVSRAMMNSITCVCQCGSIGPSSWVHTKDGVVRAGAVMTDSTNVDGLWATAACSMQDARGEAVQHNQQTASHTNRHGLATWRPPVLHPVPCWSQRRLRVWLPPALCCCWRAPSCFCAAAVCRPRQTGCRAPAGHQPPPRTPHGPLQLWAAPTRQHQPAGVCAGGRWQHGPADGQSLNCLHLR
jgi:hypothetical protein